MSTKKLCVWNCGKVQSVTASGAVPFACSDHRALPGTAWLCAQTSRRCVFSKGWLGCWGSLYSPQACFLRLANLLRSSLSRRIRHYEHLIVSNLISYSSISYHLVACWKYDLIVLKILYFITKIITTTGVGMKFALIFLLLLFQVGYLV